MMYIDTLQKKRITKALVAHAGLRLCYSQTTKSDFFVLTVEVQLISTSFLEKTAFI